jgi:T-complex protein 1 subunit eta
MNKVKKNNKLDVEDIYIVTIPGGSLTDSFLVDGVVFERTFTYAGFEQQPKVVKNPKILLLNHEVTHLIGG